MERKRAKVYVLPTEDKNSPILQGVAYKNHLVTWSRDEYEKGLRLAFKAGISFTGPSFYGINTELQKYEDKWIEDNL